ncbi:MAG: hypothetical protein K2X47_14345 [Bdellovibrionales bacterium]|nr:hypothetical protein [Bdellovibrionales bacterium]
MNEEGTSPFRMIAVLNLLLLMISGVGCKNESQKTEPSVAKGVQVSSTTSTTIPLTSGGGSTTIEDPVLELSLRDGEGRVLTEDSLGRPVVPTFDLGAGFFVSWSTKNADYVIITGRSASRSDPPPGFPYPMSRCYSTSLMDIRARRNSVELEPQGSRTFTVGHELRIDFANNGSTVQEWYCDLGLSLQLSARAAKRIGQDVIYSEEKNIGFKTRLSDSVAAGLRHFFYRGDNRILTKVVVPGQSISFPFSSTACNAPYSFTSTSAFRASGASAALEVDPPVNSQFSCGQGLRLKITAPSNAKPGKYLFNIRGLATIQETKSFVAIISDDPGICLSGIPGNSGMYDIGCLIQ